MSCPFPSLFNHTALILIENLANTEMSKAERLLSYSLISLITSKPLAATSQSPHIPGIAEEDEDEDSDSSSPPDSLNTKTHVKYKGKGLINEDGAWCWREGCRECLSLSKSIQRTAETLQNVADLYDDHVCNLFLSLPHLISLRLSGTPHPTRNTRIF